MAIKRIHASRLTCYDGTLPLFEYKNPMLSTSTHKSFTKEEKITKKERRTTRTRSWSPNVQKGAFCLTNNDLEAQKELLLHKNELYMQRILSAKLFSRIASKGGHYEAVAVRALRVRRNRTKAI